MIVLQTWWRKRLHHSLTPPRNIYANVFLSYWASAYCRRHLQTSMCSKGRIAQHTPSSTKHEEFCVSLRVSFHFERLPEIVYCFVFLSTHPPSHHGGFCVMSECQRSLLDISLAFVYCWFVFLINFSLCQKRELCFICVRRRSWEFNIIMVCSSEGKYPSGVFELDCNLFKVLPCSQLTPWYPDLQLHVYPPFLGTHVAPFLQGLLTLHTSS